MGGILWWRANGNNSTILAHRDHKLVVADREISPPMPIGVDYKDAGEHLYCANESGACGATLPVLSYLNLADLGGGKARR